MFERRLKDMEWTLPSPKWIFVFNILLFLLRFSLGKTLATIHWNKNANFGTEGLELHAEINDKVEIDCPKTPNTTVGRQYAEYLTFTQVSQAGFDHCSTNISYGIVRTLLTCNRPFEDNSFILLFQRYPPLPGSPTFRHSRTYYFITTSDGTLDGLHQINRGLCHTHNMKLRVHIRPRPTEATPTGQTPMRTRPRTRSTTRPTTPTTLPTTHPKTTTFPQAITEKPKITDKPVEETPKKNNPDSQSSDNASTVLRHSWTLLLLGLCTAMLRWLTMT
ncbi:ephrin-B2-like [Acanthaster planci]|uniref:Ephrin-B2-like n=1 Tax=Acanthaster planci TaxID=133434 RepID=A0A8B7YUN8_ACAPL|nr:ephrin-B2-like [Acanthaster planci]